MNSLVIVNIYKKKNTKNDFYLDVTDLVSMDMKLPPNSREDEFFIVEAPTPPKGVQSFEVLRTASKITDRKWSGPVPYEIESNMGNVFSFKRCLTLYIISKSLHNLLLNGQRTSQVGGYSANSANSAVLL